MYADLKNERRDYIKWTIWGFLFLLVLSIAAGSIGLVLKVASTPGRVISKTLDTDNVIYNYEWFKRQHEEIDAQSQKILYASAALSDFVAGAGPRKDWGFEDKQEFARLNSIVLGLQNQRAAMVAEYNARTQMVNRDLFRTSDLPMTVR